MLKLFMAVRTNILAIRTIALARAGSATHPG
jgi:hypothetical protein